ncbi:MAG: MFS transporter [Prevotella sp.]|nr:MFS transporter [Prevotella sp.]
MNTQSTPVHISLWHRDFWLLVLTDLLLTVAVYLLIPVLPLWLMDSQHLSPEQTGWAMGAFGLGLYLLGAQCSWLVQHYRRNVVCLWAMTAMAATLALLWYFDTHGTPFVPFWFLLLQRFLLGASFGLAQMILSSTLIIDTCESFHRTEANHHAAWFARFALSLGPLAGLLVYSLFAFQGVVWTAVGCVAVSFLLVRAINFPFRAPEENIHVVSLDRFFLPHGFPLFANLLMVSTTVGLLLTLPLQPVFFAYMMGGFLLALLAQRFVFRNAELKSEVVSGLLLLIAAEGVLLVAPESSVAPVLVGLSTGIVGTRFLLFFIKLSRHCQRGTSQSTSFLGWESGLALGLALGYLLFYLQPEALIYTALLLTVAALLLYHCFTHAWFMRNKNR